MGTSSFEKAQAGLWTSLQAHLAAVYAAEKAFTQSVPLTDALPFSTGSLAPELLDDYWRQRRALRDLYTDETVQLDALIKAIRAKAYAEDEKKQLYLLLLGYLDVVASVVALLDTHAPTGLPPDPELAETAARFDRLRRFVRLNLKGLPALLGPR